MDSSSQHVKHLMSTDKRHGNGEKNRLRFASSRQRSKQATADVYRNYKRRTGVVTSAATREERVHHHHASPQALEIKALEIQDRKRKNDKDDNKDDVSDDGSPTTKRSRLSSTTTKTTTMRADQDTTLQIHDNTLDNDNDNALMATDTLFTSELDLALERNGSEVFVKFHRQVWHLVRSLPEVLHHAEKVIDLLLFYMLSPVNVGVNNNNTKQQQQQQQSSSSRTNNINENTVDDEDDDNENVEVVEDPPAIAADDENNNPKNDKDNNNNNKQAPPRGYCCYQPNLATTDILHLLAVLARDLRHEIHPFLHVKILPRILYDLLNPPSQKPQQQSSSSSLQQQQQQHQAIPLDVVIVEAAFRTMSYIFRYDAEALLEEKTATNINSNNKKDNPNEEENDDNEQPCLEPLRQYYGVTLANRRELVRRLAAESFAPLIRKLSSDNAKKRHLKRVINALATSSSSSSASSTIIDPVHARLQADAIDGISKLCFEVARGAAGVLHSKAGPLVVKCVLDCVAHKADLDNEEEERSAGGAAGGGRRRHHALVHAVGMAFIQLAMQQLKPSSVAVVLKETLQTTQHALFPKSSGNRDGDKKGQDQQQQLRHGGNRPLSVVHILQLANQVIPSQNSGAQLVLEQQEGIKEYLLETLELVFGEKCFSVLTVKSRQAAMETLCLTWTVMARSDNVATPRLCRLLADTPGLFNRTGTKTTSSLSSNNSLSMILTRFLLPHLPLKIAMSKVGTVLLTSALQQQVEKRDDSIILAWIFALASLQEKSLSSSIIMDNDDTFHPENARLCEVSSSMQESLLSICLVDLESVDFSFVNIANDDFIVRLRTCCHCAVFVTMLTVPPPPPHGKKSQNNKHYSNIYKQVSKWLGRLLQRIGDSVKDKQSQAAESKVSARGQEDLTHLFSIAIEALARLSLAAIDSNSNVVVDVKMIESSLMKIRPAVETHLLSNSSSLPAVRSSATFAVALKTIEKSFCNDRDALFHALIPNLCEDNHFLRLHTLRFLTTFPNLPFVTDHADLDLTDDLDEEPSGQTPTALSTKMATGPTGICDIMHILYELESAPVAFAKERELLSLVSRVEVLGRCGKLPVVYAEAATCHLLGLFNVRFGPLWPGLVQGLVALYHGHEQYVWPHISRKLAELMDKTPYRKVDSSQTAATESSTATHQTFGTDTASSDAPLDFDEEKGRISRIRSTDQGQVLQSIWSIFEAAPQLAATHSRDLIPIVLRFLHAQFFHPRDPDALELRLEDHIDSVHKGLDTETQVDRRAVEARLVAVLKAFSALNGPQQLFKHKLMFQIFVCLLGHNEATVGQLALSCVLRFKPRYLMPYGEVTKKLFMKGKMRDAMLQLKDCAQNDVLNQEHRSDFFPLLARILMGRLSARAGATSKKDSPAARRIAIFSFVAAMCKKDDELYPFVYLTLRRYIPPNTPTKAIEVHDENDRAAFLAQLKSLTSDDCCRLPTPVHEGFLNVLDAIVSQLGHRVLRFVPSFMDIILSLLEVYEVKELFKMGDSEKLEDESGGTGPLLRAGAVRGLCYRRLTELFERFAEVFEFGTYSNRIWSCLDRALVSLPEAAANSDKAPSLLLLLRTLSSNTKLITVLAKNDLAVGSVLKCLSGTSCESVVNATLTFIDNLLPKDSANDDKFKKVEGEFDGAALIKKHIDVLLRQFRISLGSRNSINNWRRELNLLCRTSVLILGKKDDTEAVRVEELESLSSLLFPFLDLGQRISDQDRLTVLGILQSMIPRLPSEVARTYYSSLAPALGPSRGRAGLTSKKGRESIASVFCLISQHHYHGAKPVADVVRRLCAVHSKRIDEYDYDTIISALGVLSASGDNESSWLSMVQTPGCGGSVVLSPIIHSCFNFVYEDDGVVARSAVKALKELIALAAQMAGFNVDETKVAGPTSETDEWKRLLEGTLMPLIRSGLASRDASYRRFFVQLLSEAVRACRTSGSPNLYGDLACLIHAEEQDLDFFMNITHVQIHRRTRALRRLRKHVTTDPDSIGLQSISNILLPLALHPVYESKTKLEEPFALEAIATIGALARLLSWSKYNNTLWTTLTQFHRHPEQERYIIGVVCSIIDAFHFDVAMSDAGDDSTEKSSVLRALENRIICKVEDLLVKEKVARGGTKMRVLRPAVVLALVKLFQKLPRKNFEAKAPRLLTVICDSLKSRESDARDLARSTLAKVAVEISLDFLPDILRELTVTLKEGYQVHVRAATVHTILLEISGTYKPTVAKDDGQLSQLPFDAAVPSLMDMILADLWGVAQERKDATDNQVRFVKEAGGSKSLHSLELISSMLFFDPKSNAGKTSVSSIHAVVFPLLDRLRADGLTTKTIRRIREALSRVVQGLSRNPTFSPKAALPFVYATLTPFVSKEEIEATLDAVNDLESDDDDDSLKPIAVSGATKLDDQKEKETRRQPIKQLPVVEWRPSVIQASTTRSAAMQAKTRTEISDRRVLDGASAPKLTGSSRRTSSVASRRGSLNDDATSSAIVFALQVLHSCLRKGINTHDPAMLDPFVPLLTTCFCQCREADIVLLSLRCLGSLLHTELPSIQRFAKALSGKTLDLLVSSGNNQELLQATFKMLTLLINLDRSSAGSRPTAGSRSDEDALKGGNAVPLDAEQMQVLLSFLQSSIVESDQHNPALALVKAIMSRRFVSPEIYDLMKTLLEQSVRSPKPSLREQCNVIFVNFLLNYPMTENRLEQELKQIVLNLGYEHADGRLSAIALVNSVVDRLPEPVLVQRGQFFFLPLTLQLANDESKKCREAVAKGLSALLSRLPTESLQSLYDYTCRWSESDDRLLRRTSLLLYSIFVDSCDTFMKRGDTIERLISTIGQLLIDEFGDWEVVYLALVCLEKLPPQSLLDKNDNVWKSIAGCMVHRHVWVQAVSCRLVSNHLQGLDAISFFDNESTTFLRVPGSLFQLARNFCRVLNRDEAEFTDDEELSALVAKALSWIVRAMNRYPDLCYSDNERAQDDGDRDPVWWLMRRLNNIAKPKGDKRRQAIFKCFAAFATSCMDIASNYLELMIEPIQRAERESLNELERPSLLNNAPIQDSASDLAKEVLHLIEEHCESHEKFVHAYAEVKKRARDKKDQRKATETTEAAVDPKAAAQRKIKKKEQEQKRRKRRVEERRQGRGAVAKRRHLN